MQKDWTGNNNSIWKTLGASSHTDKEREQNDYYATEPKALELLLELEKFSPYVWECACGDGCLSKVLEKADHTALSTDLIDRGYGMAGVDFLQCTEVFDGDIITNPPYKYAKEFVEKAYELITQLEYELYNQQTYIESKYVRKEMYDIILERHKRSANDYIRIKREKESLIQEIIDNVRPYDWSVVNIKDGEKIKKQEEFYYSSFYSWNSKEDRINNLKLTSPRYIKNFYEIKSEEELNDLKKCLLDELKENENDTL